MPIIKSAKKRVLVTEKKNAMNSSKKSALRTSVKKARIAIENNDNAAEAVKVASVDLDKAASKGLIHKKTADRKKSRLAKALNKAQ